LLDKDDASLVNAANCLIHCGLFDHAQAILEEALSRRPDHAPTWFNLGCLWLTRQAFANAEMAFTQAICLDSNDPDSWRNRGIAKRALGSIAESNSDLVHAVELMQIQRAHEQLSPRQLLSRAMTFGQLKLHEKAIEDLKALALDDEGHTEDSWVQHTSLANLAMAYGEIERLDCAIKLLKPLLEADDCDPDLCAAAAMFYWRLGRWREGLSLWERRGNLPSARHPASSQLAKCLSLCDALEGRKLLVLPEQGLGDCFQALRYLQSLQALGCIITLMLPAEMCSLVARSFSDLTVTEESVEAPAHDLWCGILSLAYHCEFRGLLANPKQSKPYLLPRPRPKLVALGRGDQKTSSQPPTAQPSKKLRIGVSWRGNPMPPINQNRFIPLALLLPLFEREAHWFSLQWQPTAAELRLLDHHPHVIRTDPGIKTLDDVASICCDLDLVITVDSAIAHLAGGLGVCQWLLLKKAHEWRWYEHQAFAPLYPNVRKFVQREAENWHAVIEEVTLALDAKIS
jgi:tetratricopeptide (TPR) repeat protein